MIASLLRRLERLESLEHDLVEYPTDDRPHETKLAELHKRHGLRARFRLPRGTFDELVDTFA